LFSGPPGTGKTMACRWIQAEAHRRGWETRVVSADTLRTARFSDNADALFHFHDRGLVFLDDMDHPMRERALGDAEDQAVLLTALDGIRTKARVVYVFTSNCPLKNIDSAFLRPGRVDVGVLFTQPGSSLRKRLLATWHPEIRAALDETRFIRATDGYSFAQLDEVRNLMVMSYLVRGVWSLDDALNQLEGNGDFAQTSEPMGFRSEVSAQA
jgi:ATP-dependent 26S proteasome regulatory subunit